MKKRKDGRFVQTLVIDGKRIYFYGKSIQEINKKIFAYQDKQKNKARFDFIADDWWDVHEPTLEKQSVNGYKSSLASCKAFFKDFFVYDIKPKDIKEYLDIETKKGYSKKTIAHRKMVLNQIFNYAIFNEYLQCNPVVSVKLPRSSKQHKRPPATQTDEQLIKDSFDVWMFPFIVLYTGMRKGEVLALQWKDIDFDNDLIYVTKSLAHNVAKPFIKEPKTESGKRVIPLLAPLKEKLLSVRGDPDDLLFASQVGKPYTLSTFKRKYERFQKETGVKATAHQIRHSYATILFENGVDAKTVQELLGHKQVSTTLDIYTEFRKKKVLDVKNELEKALK